jgi:4'-phosphopantetheinyl transferase
MNMCNLEQNRLEKTVSLQLWQRELTVNEEDYQRYWQMLDAIEHHRAGTIKNELLLQRFVASYGMLRSILSQTVGQPPHAIRINRTEHGKPYLADYPRVSFNLSHTGNTMVIAIGRNCRLGIDIETRKPRANLPALVAKCFSEVEAAWWYGLPDIDKNREFYRFWTRKEAFVKATGRGIGLGLHHCVVNPENPATWLSVPPSYGPASAWHIQDIDLGEEVCSAVVADKAIANVELIPN